MAERQKLLLFPLAHLQDGALQLDWTLPMHLL